jgi:hypothetical protein
MVNHNMQYKKRSLLYERAQQQRAAYEEEQKNKKMIAWLEGKDMTKPIITYEERGLDLQLDNMEIVTDPMNLDRVEIYILDERGERIEGGTFSKDAFMSLVRKFYDDNY